MTHHSCLLAVLLCFSLIIADTGGNANETCRVAGICGGGGSFKQITFDFSDVGGLPVVQVRH